MARTMSTERINELTENLKVNNSVMERFKDSVETFVDFMEDNSFKEIIKELSEVEPGIARSINANYKLLVEADIGFTTTFGKFVANTEAVKESMEKKEDKTVDGVAKKVSGWFWHCPLKGETKIEGDLGETVAKWAKGGGKDTIVHIIPSRYAGEVEKEIVEEIGHSWDGKDLVIQKDKRRLVLYRMHGTEIGIRR